MLVLVLVLVLYLMLLLLWYVGVRELLLGLELLLVVVRVILMLALVLLLALLLALLSLIVLLMLLLLLLRRLFQFLVFPLHLLFAGVLRQHRPMAPQNGRDLLVAIAVAIAVFLQVIERQIPHPVQEIEGIAALVVVVVEHERVIQSRLRRRGGRGEDGLQSIIRP